MKVLQEIIAPQETVNEEFVTITKVYFKTGDKVKKGDTLIDIETSKATLSIDSETDGYVEYLCQEDDDVEIGEIMVKVYDSFDIEAILEEDDSAEPDESDLSEITFSKSALELIEKEKIDKNLFKEYDFVTLDDVRDVLEKS